MKAKVGLLVSLWLLIFCSTSVPATCSEKKSGAGPELVIVPVQVRDGSDKAVHGLTLKDFTLQSDGKPLSLTSVSEINAETVADVCIEDLNQATSPQRFSNIPRGGMPRQLLIIALDFVNSAFLGKGEAQQKLFKYVLEGLPNQPFELVAITPTGLVQIHSFSAPRSDTAEALRRISADLLGESRRPEKAQANEEYSRLSAVYQAKPVLGGYGWEIAARATLTSMRQLADAYTAVPGRKSVIWLTAGIRAMGGDPTSTARQRGSFQIYLKSPLSTDSQLRAAYDEAFRALNTADMAIYPVDLKPMKDVKIYVANFLPAAVMNNPNIYVPTLGPFETNDGIKPLAAETGGRPCSVANDLKLCIDQAVNDASSYYLLGFSVPQEGRKGGWHKLEATTTSGGSKARTRSRYFLPSQVFASDTDIRDYVTEIAKSNLTYTGVRIVVERLPDSPSPAEDPINLRIRVPMTSVGVQPGQQKLSYQIAMAGISSSGEPMNAVRLVQFDATEEQTQEALTRGWRVNEALPKADSMASVRYVIRDTATGKIGSVTVPLQDVSAK